jgi:hypothetical protein
MSPLGDVNPHFLNSRSCRNQEKLQNTVKTHETVTKQIGNLLFQQLSLRQQTAHESLFDKEHVTQCCCILCARQTWFLHAISNAD